MIFIGIMKNVRVNIVKSLTNGKRTIKQKMTMKYKKKLNRSTHLLHKMRIFVLLSIFMLISVTFVIADEVWYDTPDTEILNDAFIKADSSTTNFGAFANLRIRQPTTSPGLGFVNYITFINTVPQNAIITNATFTLYHYFRETDAGALVVVDMYTNGTAAAHWDEDTITWANAPCNGVPTSDWRVIPEVCNITSLFESDSMAIGNISMDVLPAVKRAVSQGQTNISFIFSTENGSTSQESQFRSKEATLGAGESYPTLYIEYTVPPPVAADPTIEVLHPQENSFINNNTFDFNVTVGIDPLAVFSNYTIYINNTPLFTQIGTPDNVSFPLADGLWNLTAIVRDNESNEGHFDVTRFIVDTVNPGDNLLTQIPDPTTYYSSQNITITALNTNLFGHNLTIRDSLDNILFSEEVLNISAPQNNIIAQIQASWGAGTYSIISNESDDHTVNAIKDYVVTHNNANKMISFNTGESDVTVKLVESWMQVGAAPYTPINSNVLSIVNNKQTDRYTFGFDFSNPAADSYKYKFEIVTDDEIIYRESSPYKGHFVLNNANWLDFEPYDVTVTHDGTNYFVEFETSDTEIRFQSIGGVNVETTESSFILSVPSAPGIECGVNGVRASCSTLSVGDSLTGMYSTCANAHSSFHSLFLTSSNISIDSGFAVDIGGDEYYFNSTDALLVDGSTVDFNATCFNDVGQIDSQAQIQTVTVSVPGDDSSTLSGWTDGAGLKLVTFLVTILIIILLFTVLKSQLRGRKQ